MMANKLNDEKWEPARLIPVSGIRGAEEQERRGVSALLAVIESVREFGWAITGPLGAPKGAVSTFIEVPFDLKGRRVRPDGVIRVRRGRKQWLALVEVKTGRNDLKADQLDDYLDVAREYGIDVVLTISNQLVTVPGEHPTAVDRKKLRKLSLQHLSWSRIHTEAVIERLNRSVADPDQAWILAELIRYLEHPRSGAVDFDDMGPSWVGVRNAVAQRSLRQNDPGANDVVARFAQLTAFAGMQLSRTLGVSVQPALTHAEMTDPATYVQNGITRLVETGVLRGSLRVPHAVAPIEVAADVRAGLVTCSVTVSAPGQGRNRTRVNWLTRQLKDAPARTMIEAVAFWARTPGPSKTLTEAREQPDGLFDDPKKELKSFTVWLSATSGTKRGQGRGSFVGSILDLIEEFYENVVQPIKAWMPPAPAAKPRPTEVEDFDEDGIAGQLPVAGPIRTDGSAPLRVP
jgi:hypothetical protein